MTASAYPLVLPAIKVSQPLGDFWAVSLSAQTLRQCASLDPTRIAAVNRQSFLYTLIGSQRDASLVRARDIAKYINSVEAAFPNSVILGANYTEEGPLADNSPNRWELISEGKNYYVKIPQQSKSVVVIDGQHRLLGFDYATEDRQGMELLCAVYFDLPQAYQAYLFATININQRKVDKSLAYEQFGYNLDDEKSISWAPDKLAVYFSRKLNLDPASPFFGHIKVAPLDAEKIFPNQTQGDWMISTACIVEGILSLISSKPRADRDLIHVHDVNSRSRKFLLQDSSPLRDLFKEGKDEEILNYITIFFSTAKSIFWSKANSKSFIRKTIGIQALFDILRYLLLKYDHSLLQKKTNQTLQAAESIGFDHSFFQASGRGRVRVKNVILRAAGEIGPADLPDTDMGAYALYAQETKAFK